MYGNVMRRSGQYEALSHDRLAYQLSSGEEWPP